ncbi:MAG: sulfotransferase domain-containing protein [Rhodospirillaceae bacterium]|nr:sulfotransferase domain-containing protein [Rhodospirillaceae bacterium]
MIVWIASYPRSGNTLARILLHRVFGIASVSEYAPRRASYADVPIAGQGDVPAFGARDRRLRRLIAEGAYLPYDGPFEEFLDRARSAPERVFVKSHGAPRDASPAIYVVRDGRSALVSQYHYLAARLPEPVSLAEIVCGTDPQSGSWSRHLTDWQPLTRPDTLLLRYEQLAQEPDAAIERLAGFLGTSPRAPWRNPFDEFHALDPSFFRNGSDARNLAEMTAPVEALFWTHHGAWMRKLGYGAGPPQSTAR